MRSRYCNIRRLHPEKKGGCNACGGSEFPCMSEFRYVSGRMKSHRRLDNTVSEHCLDRKAFLHKIEDPVLATVSL